MKNLFTMIKNLNVIGINIFLILIQFNYAISQINSPSTTNYMLNGQKMTTSSETKSISSGWSTPGTAPTNKWLTDIFVFDMNTAIAVGGKGTIIKTTDGGVTWSKQFNDTLINFTAVHFVNSQIGWVVGHDRNIFKTTDGGLSWIQQSYSMSNRRCFDVFFIDVNTGWMVCRDNWTGYIALVYKTTDGGYSWESVQTGVSLDMKSIFFINSTTGWIVGNSGTILKSTDGGLSWSSQSNPTKNDLQSIFFIDPNIGWAVGGGILKTTDAGAHWTVVSSESREYLLSVKFIDALTGWAVGVQGLILKSTDGGSNWAAQASGTNEQLYSIYIQDALSVWACGYNGKILKTSDGGGIMLYQPTLASPVDNSCKISTNPILSWNYASGASSYQLLVSEVSDFYTTIVSQYVNDSSLAISGLSENTIYYWCVRTQYPEGNSNWSKIRSFATSASGTGWYAQVSLTNADFRSIFFIDTQTGWCVGRGWGAGGYEECVMKTTDGGEHWTKQLLMSQAMLSVYFINSSIGWITCAYGDIWKTTDGGTNWIKANITSGTWDYWYSCFFVDTLTGWILGSAGSYKTNDGGLTWTLPTTHKFSDIYILDNSIGWGIDGDKPFKTIDGGVTWIQQPSVDSVGSITFINAQTAYMIGSKLFKTTDSGNNWTLLMRGTNYFSSVNFFDNNVGWSIGNDGSIMKTINDGINWGVQPTKVNKYIRSLFFINDSTGWAVGDNGVILKTSTGGILTSVEESGKYTKGEPDNFQLYQNFPNPFNPSTTVSFSLPSNAFVSLKVFDILGREVAIIAFEQMSKGTYSRQWNAANMSSGIYFYRLQAGSFTETKKLILLK